MPASYDPIIRFTYNSESNQYDTTLASGVAGPPVSLSEMFVLKELAAAEAKVLVKQEEVTSMRVQIEAYTQKAKTINEDLTANMGALLEAVDKVVNTVNL